MSLARILLVIALFYLLYSVIRRLFLSSGNRKNRQQFKYKQSGPQKPEGHISVEKPSNKSALKDDDFIDYEEIK